MLKYFAKVDVITLNVFAKCDFLPLLKAKVQVEIESDKFIHSKLMKLPENKAV